MFLQLETLHEFIFNKFCQAGSGSAFFKQLDPDPYQKNCWIRIRKKLMRIHSPVLKEHPIVFSVQFKKKISKI